MFLPWPLLGAGSRSRWSPPILGGVRTSERIALLTGADAWTPTMPIPIVANMLSPLSAQQVDFKFSSAGGRWLIDDVYVDPYGKG